jgi:ribosome-associated protein
MPDQPADSIRLDQFLKVQGVVATGGQAKMMIQGGEVEVNGEVETRRGRQLHVGDVVCIEDLRLSVELS